MIRCGFGSARPTKTACCVRPVRGLISEKLFAMKLRGSPWSSFGHLPSFLCCPRSVLPPDIRPQA